MKLKLVSRRAGFNLLDALVLIAIFALATILILPRVARSKPRAARINCVNNLKQVGLAFRCWALDNQDKFPTRLSASTNGAMELAETGAVWTVFQVMSNELNTPKLLVCPNDTKRKPAGSFSQGFGNTNLSYFISLDADETQPQMFLAGDDNWLIGGNPAARGVVSIWTNTPVAWTTARHNKQGNVALADGSVQGFSSARLGIGLASTGFATNRLAFP